MDDDPRNKKKVKEGFPKPFFSPKSRNDNHSSRNSRHEATPLAMYEKRQRVLNNFELQPPEYLINSQYLIEEHVEKAVRYAGEIDGVSPHIDITNRTDVLRIIDKGKKQEVIPAQVSPENNAVLSLSVFNIKISKYNASEDLLLRIPMHEIAAICYIKDDQQHTLAIKFGTPESCKLAVLYCESKTAAEEICALVGQCFHLVYMEATVDLLERQIRPLELGGGGSTPTGTVSTIVNNTRQANKHSFETESRFSRVPSDSGSNRNSDSVTGDELLKDYMTKLTTKLNAEELRKFAQHLQEDWQRDNRFDEFCDKVLVLLGPDRKQLLSEMLPFIPVDNYQHFEEFLRRNDILLLENSSTLSSSRTNLRSYPTRRSLGEVSTTSSVSNNATSGEALDHLLDLANAQYNSVDVDIDPTHDVPSEDY
ncbi:cerebral cavernous malformations 2 protein [Aplysia californica]|uniref:Cerebral cavernous malformations 2 protein n=1 Tax=Aplysia californica TaxID=6500 RepID=A0ABM0JQN9_APLCA|nr:cerebral cavernous malformations 2 protein [Aplysia californica]